MENHIIYLITDANRTHIEAIYSTTAANQFFNDNHQLLVHKSNRIVYVENFGSYEDAQRRKNELETYTQMMKERLVRRQNPNWLNIKSMNMETHNLYRRNSVA